VLYYNSSCGTVKGIVRLIWFAYSMLRLEFPFWGDYTMLW